MFRVAVCDDEEYFRLLEKELIEKYMEENVKREFCSLLVLEGEGSLRSAYGSIELSKGDSIFLPKEAGAFRITGRLQILLSEV